MSISVSGLGIKTFSLIQNSYFQKDFKPVKYAGLPLDLYDTNFLNSPYKSFDNFSFEFKIINFLSLFKLLTSIIHNPIMEIL